MIAERHRLRRLAVLCLVACSALTVVADDYTLDWYTIDGGGEMWSTGGDYELSGTIGQADTGIMTGGDYELSGGFWPVAGAPQWQPGDLNCDGAVNNFDITPFVNALTATPPDYPEYYTAYPNCDRDLADINGDGRVDNFDITPFVALLIGS